MEYPKKLKSSQVSPTIHHLVYTLIFKWPIQLCIRIRVWIASHIFVQASHSLRLLDWHNLMVLAFLGINGPVWCGRKKWWVENTLIFFPIKELDNAANVIICCWHKLATSGRDSINGRKGFVSWGKVDLRDIRDMSWTNISSYENLCENSDFNGRAVHL